MTIVEQTAENALRTASPLLPAHGDEGASSIGAQYVAFTVGGAAFAVDVMSVREIRAWTNTTALPNSAHYVRGIINLRGEIVPVIDMRRRFGQGDTDPTGTHVILVVSIRGKLTGLLVEAVSDLLVVEEGEIAPVPQLASAAQQRFLAGLITRDELIAVIDLEALID